MDLQVADNPKTQLNSSQGPQVLHEAIGALKSILRPEELQDENIESPAGILRIIEAKLQDNRFFLAVLGQFKRGKSTFINAVLEDEILPTGVIPLTSVVTTIQYSSEVNVEVIYNTGKNEKITPHDLQEIVTERGNPGNRLGVSFVKIGHPSKFLKDGLVLVDTPGVGSLQEANTTETLAYLPRIDAAIFLLSVDQPINAAELDFISLSKSFAPKIYFILNKIDLVAVDELAESVGYCRDTLSKHLSEVLLYPVSSSWYLQGLKEPSGIPALVSDLQDSIVKKRDLLGLKSNMLRLNRCMGMLKEKNSLEEKAVMASRQQLADSIDKLKSLQTQVQQAKEDFRHILRGETQRVLKDLGDQVESHRQIKTRELTKGIYNHYNHNKAATEEIEKYAFEHLYEELEAWRPNLTDLFEHKTKHLLERFIAQAQILAAEVVLAGGDVLGVAVSSQLPDPQWTGESTLEYFIENEVGLIPIRLEKIIAPLPWCLTKRFILSRVNDNVEKLFDRNCGRIRVDISERLNKTAQEYFKLWEAELDRIVGVINGAVQKAIRVQTDEGSKTTWEREMKRRQEVIQEVEKKITELSTNNEL